MLETPKPKFNIGDKVVSTRGVLGEIGDREFRKGSDIKGEMRMAGLNPKLSWNWEYIVIGDGFDLNTWYDETGLSSTTSNDALFSKK
jgi:hypothetical protein